MFAQQVPGLQPGIHTQHYRAASGWAKFRSAWIKDAKVHGVVGLVEHGFVGTLSASDYQHSRDEVHAAGYQSGVAFGLGDVGTHGPETGRAIAAVAKFADYLVPDMEGLWEDDALDEQKACEMFDAIRQVLPDIPIVDQPPSRPIPNHHGSRIWRTMAKYTTGRAPQLYLCNLNHDGPGGLGQDAYERIMPDFENDWNVWIEQNTQAGITPDPVIPTWQSYHWVLEAHVDALLKYETCLSWCENHGNGTGCHAPDDQSMGPYPTDRARKAMKVVHGLRTAGFTGHDAVAKFRAAKGLPPASMRQRQDGKVSTVPVIGTDLLLALGLPTT